MDVADGADDGGVEAGGSPGGFRGLEQVVYRGVYAVRPVMAPQVMPEILDRILFRRVRRQTHERDLRRADQVVRPMKSRAASHQDRLQIRFQRRRHLGEEQVHDRRVEPRRDQSFGLAGRSARRRQDRDETVLRLSDCARSRAQARASVSGCPSRASSSWKTGSRPLCDGPGTAACAPRTRLPKVCQRLTKTLQDNKALRRERAWRVSLGVG